MRRKFLEKFCFAHILVSHPFSFFLDSPSILAGVGKEVHDLRIGLSGETLHDGYLREYKNEGMAEKGKENTGERVTKKIH